MIIAVGSSQLIADRTIALQALQKLRTHMYDHGTLLIDIFVPEIIKHNQRSTGMVRLNNHQVIRFSTRYLFHEQKNMLMLFVHTNYLLMV